MSIKAFTHAQQLSFFKVSPLNTIEISNRANSIKPSATIAVSTLAKELRAAGRDVIGLGAGEPDFDTPSHIKDAAIQAMHAGMTKYTPADGVPELKQAICDKFQQENNLQYDISQIVISTGAKQCIYNLLTAILNDDDEVLILAPYWVSYPDMTLLCGGKPVIVNAGIDQNFKVRPEQIRAAMTPRTKLIMINSPGNPTGVAYTREELAGIAEAVLEHPSALVMTDDIYEHIRWTGKPFCNIVNACPEIKDRTVVINGVSKAYAMTGWRIGYSASHETLTAAMRKIQSQTTSNPNSIAQAAAIAALNGGRDEIDHMVSHFSKRHDFVIEQLNAIDGVSCLRADGAFYAFPDFSEVIRRIDGIESDAELAQYILNEADVALVPGGAFGGKGYLRLSYATGMDNLEKAMQRLHRLFA